VDGDGFPMEDAPGKSERAKSQSGSRLSPCTWSQRPPILSLRAAHSTRAKTTLLATVGGDHRGAMAAASDLLPEIGHFIAIART
jgi:hypothetical protein